ncbi:hypothetical protein [Nocardia iowensis]|uniref:Uncharacterized protein n=1 Tax=Nocardia iowensis TaxID=204891 RepID=A0ABX8RLW0_NOCIO|nr:hypothetical protein [Nocardia iowensis]QXN90296.1 hypothetical protein KV110_33540 [Nocardia iowensis]
MQHLDAILVVEGGLGEIVSRRPNEIAPSVRRLLAEFNDDTLTKLRIAPLDGRPKTHLSDGSLCVVDEDGWVCRPGEEDTPPTIEVDPISVSDTPEHTQLPRPQTPSWHVRLWRASFVLACVLTLVPAGTLIMTATGHNDGSVLAAAIVTAVSALGAILVGFMYRSNLPRP